MTNHEPRLERTTRQVTAPEEPAPAHPAAEPRPSGRMRTVYRLPAFRPPGAS
jgi:hypothetical protein